MSGSERAMRSAAATRARGGRIHPFVLHGVVDPRVDAAAQHHDEAAGAARLPVVTTLERDEERIDDDGGARHQEGGHPQRTGRAHRTAQSRARRTRRARPTPPHPRDEQCEGQQREQEQKRQRIEQPVAKQPAHERREPRPEPALPFRSARRVPSLRCRMSVPLLAPRRIVHRGPGPDVACRRQARTAGAARHAADGGPRRCFTNAILFIIGIDIRQNPPHPPFDMTSADPDPLKRLRQLRAFCHAARRPAACRGRPNGSDSASRPSRCRSRRSRRTSTRCCSSGPVRRSV